MTSKFLLILQSIAEASVKLPNEKLITILAIALITMTSLVALNIYKVYQLKKEIKRLKTK
ncbi:hypothetical protein [Olleya sp. UBA1516]|uniref:hypothetical protein n=1 Tax=Olleya sp. UBA1516 TaxID=1947013 RepID=UPI0025D0728D|nr:hypothetical protein [Olleya sp. UBA1516]|tara:strand:+ start:462 stop:641 length:180 start_codon:yes stop_codon:yes gene_type:complete